MERKITELGSFAVKNDGSEDFKTYVLEPLNEIRGWKLFGWAGYFYGVSTYNVITFWGGKETPDVPILTVSEVKEFLTGEEIISNRIVWGDGWISVKDKLPITWGEYLVHAGQWIGSCHFDGEFYDYPAGDRKREHRYTIAVTHWMPLPQPPKS